MPHLYKATEWQDPIGRWHVNDVQDLTSVASKWWAPARLLELSLTDYILLLKETYHASNFDYFSSTDTLTFSFESLQDARKFKNFINAWARQKNFII